jgi:hypothetical protein
MSFLDNGRYHARDVETYNLPSFEDHSWYTVVHASSNSVSRSTLLYLWEYANRMSSPSSSSQAALRGPHSADPNLPNLLNIQSSESRKSGPWRLHRMERLPRVVRHWTGESEGVSSRGACCTNRIRQVELKIPELESS